MIKQNHPFKISAIVGDGVKMSDETTRRYRYSADLNKVWFPFERTADHAFIQIEIVLVNRSNGYRPVFIQK